MVRTHKVIHRTLALVLVCLSAACSTGPKLLAADPANGALFPGEIALVDDGSCPAGQVRQVTGGSNRVYGTDIKKNGVPRRYACIPRPQ